MWAMRVKRVDPNRTPLNASQERLTLDWPYIMWVGLCGSYTGWGGLDWQVGLTFASSEKGSLFVKKMLQKVGSSMKYMAKKGSK